MLKRNDTVMVVTGKEKGKTGKILEILADRNRARVEKLNRVKRHQKPTPKMPQGGMIEKEASIHLSNLMFYCTKCSKPVRLGWTRTKEGKKMRSCRKCKEEIAA